MLYYAAASFLLAIIAAVVGFTSIAAGMAEIARILFSLFLLIFFLSLVIDLVKGGRIG